MAKNELIKTFSMDVNTYKKLSEWAEKRAISRSSALRILINENCR